jgi:hypothetical protein
MRLADHVDLGASHQKGKYIPRVITRDGAG